MTIRAGRYTIPLWVTCVFLMGSYVQVFHDAYLVLDRELLKWVGGLFGDQKRLADPQWISGPVNLMVNLPLAILFLFLYLREKRVYVSVAFCFITVMFMMCIFLTAIGDDASADLDMLGFGGLSILSGGLVCLVEWVRGMLKK